MEIKEKLGIDKILKTYKDRLVNLSSRNRTICTSKIYKKNGIDVSSIEKINPGIANNLFKMIIDRSQKPLLLVEDFNSTKLLKNDFYLDANETKEKALSEKIKDNIGIAKNIAAFWTTVDEIEKEKGLYEMFVGFPFIEGQFKDETPCRSPLFLFPVSLKKESTGWVVENLLSENIQVNKNFLLAFKNINNSKFEMPLEDEFEKLEDIASFDNIPLEDIENVKDIKGVMNNICKYLESIGIEIENSEPINNIIKFNDYKKENYEKYQGRKFSIFSYLVLGQFPIANSSLYKDYESMMETGTTSLIDELLQMDNQEVESDEKEFIEETLKIREKDLISVTELDYSQERAVKNSVDKNNLVIYGPPGTGKSQVISNVISNYMWDQKRVLLISEKRTALDVVYKRLEKVGLSSRMAIVHDSKKDRNELYEKIVDIIETHKSGSNLSQSIEAIDKISNTIDYRVNKLDNLAEELKKERQCGYSLRELYGISKFGSEDFYKDLDMKKFEQLNREELNTIEENLEVVIPKLDYDNKEKFLYERKDFSKIQIIEKFNIEKSLGTIIQYFYQKKNSELSANIFKLSNDLKVKIAEATEVIKNKRIQSLEVISKEVDKALDDIFSIEKNHYMHLRNAIIDKIKQRKQIYCSNREKLELYKKEIQELEKLPSQIVFDNICDVINSMDRIKGCFFLSPTKFRLTRYLKEKYSIFSVATEGEYYRKINTIVNSYRGFFEQNREVILSYSESKTIYLDSIEKQQKEYENEIKSDENLHDLISEVEITLTISDIHNFIEKCEKAGLGTTYNYLQELLSQMQKTLILNREWNSIKNNFNYADAIEFINKNGFAQKEFSNILNRKYSEVKQLKKDILGLEDSVNTLNKVCIAEERIQLHLITDLQKIAKDILLILSNSEYSKNILENFNKNIDELIGLEKALEELKKYFNFNMIEEIKKSYCSVTINKLEELDKKINYDFEYIKNYDFKKSNFTEVTIDLLEFLKDLKDEPLHDMLSKLKNTFYIHWIDKSQEESQEAIDSLQNYEKIKTEIKDLMKDKQEQIPETILNKIDQKIVTNYKFNKMNNEINYRDMRNEAQKKRKVLPIRKYIEKFQNRGIFDLLPVWLLTPKVASEILPFVKDYFDIVLFDEASQMFVENSLPSIYRAKKVVVAGDDKQLRPTNIGIKKLDETGEETDLEDTIAVEEESLLDLAKLRYPRTLLSYHYRAHYEELINFSNYAFYDGRLVTVPNHIKDEEFRPIERIKVNGIWEERRNEVEAHAVYKLLKKIFLTRKEEESIGIITFNAAQQDFIREYLEDHCTEDTNFNLDYTKEISRVEEAEDKSLFVKNIENVQGDERDIIIFSTAYAKDSTGKMKYNFGTLNQKGGGNRLNVAVSRAKKKIYVVTSIEPGDLKVENAINEGPMLLKKYLQYVRAVSEGTQEEAKDILNSLSRKTQDEDWFDSPFEIEVCNDLREMGYDVRTQVGDSGYRIDLAIYDERNSKFILGIECDGAMYHSSASARERDVYRQEFLESKGWKIHRIWSHNWWNNSKRELEKIKNILES